MTVEGSAFIFWGQSEVPMKSIVKFFLLSSSLILSLQVFANESVTKEEVKQKTVEAASAAVQYTKEQKEAAQKEMEANLDALKKQIAELKASANKKSGDVKKDLKEQAAALELKQKNLRKELNQLKRSTGRAWDDMKTGMSEAIQKLSESYEKAKENFK